MIVTEESFLRRLPVCLDQRQRLRFETMVFACDILDDAHSRLCALAVQHWREAPNRPACEHASFFSACWTIVDQLHLIRLVLKASVPERLTSVHDFIDKYAAAYRLRNKMDHINPNVDNILNLKRATPAIFGELTYVLYDPANCIEIVDGVKKLMVWIIVLNGGPFLERRQVGLMHEPRGSTLDQPASHFRFSAFGAALILDEVIRDLRVVVEVIAEDLEKTVTKQAKVDAEAHGFPLGEYMKSASGNVQMALKVGYDVV